MSFPVISFVSRQHFQFLSTGSLNMCGHCPILNANKLYLTLFQRYSYLISIIMLITKYPNFFKHLVTAFDLKMVFTFCFQHGNCCGAFYQFLFLFFRFRMKIMFPWQPTCAKTPIQAQKRSFPFQIWNVFTKDGIF